MIIAGEDYCLSVRIERLGCAGEHPVGARMRHTVMLQAAFGMCGAARQQAGVSCVTARCQVSALS